MPLTLPALDNRRYEQLRQAALDRVPVHSPEWTNFNESDPGVTLVDLFAFMTETLIYRANLIPERNRLKFLNLLGAPLQPGASAVGFVSINNANGPLHTITLNNDLEVRAGQVPFRTDMGLDVLPIEIQVFYKSIILNPAQNVRDYYRQLYLSYLGGANRTLNLGVLPILPDARGRHLDPLGGSSSRGGSQLRFELPDLPANGELPANPSERIPRYKAVPKLAASDVLAEPGIVQLRLPSAPELGLWTNLDPLEAGVGEFPPALDDTALSDRLITWLRVSAPSSVQARLLWVGGNATMVHQRARVANEVLPDGTGEPDQVVILSQMPVVPGSVQLRVTPLNAASEVWDPIADLYMAGPEVLVPDPRLPPGTPPPPSGPTHVYLLDPESGQLRFGDGTHGARPPAGATLRATYDRGLGAQGNVPAGAVNQGSALPPGLTVNNPVRTWGGVEPESVAQGEKQITRVLQHQDRLVTAADFETISYRAPGIEVGRVDVLAAYNPEVGSSLPGDAPGSVTLMVVPRYDPDHPNTPTPDRLFLDALCAYLDARRLVTTEVFIRGPHYRPIWVSIGIEVAPRTSVAQASDAVKAALERFLSPLPVPGTVLPLDAPALFLPETPMNTAKGWPLRKPVLKLEIAAVANRVDGVLLVNDVTLIDDGRVTRDQVPMYGLDLPYLAGIVVGIGAPPPPDNIPGFGNPSGPARPGTTFVPVPVVPEECR